jgi:phospholipase/carboxylesterase
MPASVIIQQPRNAAEQLILLFHGVGANAQNMAPVGQRLAREFPQAFVVSVDGPQASDLGTGRQWFSVRGVSEENRIARVEAAMPSFQASVRRWQGVANVGVEGTTLVGFSQGAIMALEATQLPEVLAARMIAIAGRFAQPPRSAPRNTTVHLIHGEQDPVIPSAHSINAATRLKGLGAEVTITLIPVLGHGIDGEVLERIIERVHPWAHAAH